MKVIAINGSPRKKWNTATLLEKALEGAASKGAETELIHLYDLKYSGCTSCFSCKIKDGKSYGKCAVNDDLKGVFEKIEKAGAIILGSPIYYSAESGMFRSFFERLLFQYMLYTAPPRTVFPGKLSIGFVYTMNAPEEAAKQIGYDHRFNVNEMMAKMILGEAETLVSYDTNQFEDYTKIDSTLFNVENKLKRHKEVFPKDCEKAIEMGARFAGKGA